MEGVDYIKNIEGAERRFFSSEVRKVANTEADKEAGKDTLPEIEGYAAKFNSVTVIGRYWQFEEEILPGAFDDVLNDDVRCLFNHDPNYVLGRSKGGKGTLTLTADTVGLKYAYKTPNRGYAIDLADAIGEGDVSESSFAFAVSEEIWIYGDESKGVLDKRQIVKFSKLYDVAPVTFPAYQDTEVAQRCATAYREKNNIPDERSQGKNKGLSVLDAQITINKNSF
ncbi:HK97 family phage prohead protease [Flavobacterium sp. SLB02]|uniref:HK97 family phage prohead protease n=1 Tax=Flavobacterium sp. SLB02 TaxID=2665645 RepID=UPI0012AA3296|nr:HK97 family phage prohead protease [Flavobacterium sp. SLB02]QGK72840.1 HK97 family phage prohead protease [Flavobacterium sp. SLB02]